MRAATLAFLIVAGVGCSDPEAARQLDLQLEMVNGRIAEAQSDMSGYAEGSVLHSLAFLRLSMHEQTRAMLEQKKAAAWFYPRFSYVVRGQTYQLPPDLGQKLTELEARLRTAREEAASSQAKASGAGGLLGALAAMDVATKELLVSQLEYQITAYRNGFPPYLAAEPTAVSRAASSQGGAESVARALPVPAEPSAEEREREALQSAIGVRLLNKRFMPSNWQASRYEDQVLLEFEYSNLTEKEIRAFTGTVVFKDIFERPFLRVNLTVDDPIPPGRSTKDTDRGLKTNQFADEHQKLIATDLKDLRVDFEVESILFADGSQLGSVSP